MARQRAGVRRGLTAHLRRQLDRIADLVKDRTTARRRKRAITTLAGLYGALTLARAVDDPALSREILAAARDEFGRTRRTERIGDRRERRTASVRKR
jgi:TetR/AcrR family transcriptional repressor of nem operon